MPTVSANFSRRLFAWIFDFALFALILVIIAQLLPVSEKLEMLQHELILTNENGIRGVIDFKTWINQFALISREIDILTINNSIFNLGYIFAYFIVVPLFFGGQTLGMRIFKICIISADGTKFTFWDLFIRNVITNGLGILICSTIFVFFIPAMPFYIIVFFMLLIQILLVIISGIMILYKHDKRGLQDVITGTRVIRE